MTASDLAAETYVSLETFKRDGTGVKTPVWCAPLENKLVIFTDGTSYKVKRLKRDPRVRVAACDMRGKRSGDWVEGSCSIVTDPDHSRRAYRALARKYGLQMSIVNFFSRLSGRIGRREMLEVTLHSDESPSARD